jgi:hypothetical protein
LSGRTADPSTARAPAARTAAGGKGARSVQDDNAKGTFFGQRLRAYARRPTAGCQIAMKWHGGQQKANREERLLQQLLPLQLDVGVVAGTADLYWQIGSGAMFVEEWIEGRQQHVLGASHGL